jgi:hypothetical protein
MIEGLVRHDTEMRVEKNFVDSHGQSEVAFAFCHLLGAVRLMPRLKRIKYERLYLPNKGTAESYPNLAGTFARPIRWDLVEQQYDEMVKSSVAIKCGTASTNGRSRKWPALVPIQREWCRRFARRSQAARCPLHSNGSARQKIGFPPAVCERRVEARRVRRNLVCQGRE